MKVPSERQWPQSASERSMRMKGVRSQRAKLRWPHPPAAPASVDVLVGA